MLNPTVSLFLMGHSMVCPVYPLYLSAVFFTSCRGFSSFSFSAEHWYCRSQRVPKRRRASRSCRHPASVKRGQEAMEVVMGIFPTCWELEAMDGRNADGAEDANGDIYVRYVYGSLGDMCASSLTFHRYVFIIRPGVPHSEMALGFKCL